MFENYANELEYSLKKQGKSDRAGSTAPLRTHIVEISQEMAQVKILRFPVKHPKKYQLLKKFKNTERFNGSI